MNHPASIVSDQAAEAGNINVATGSNFRYPSLFKNLALLTIFVARTRYRHLKVKVFPSRGS
jgi:hypothetical protein